MKILYKQLSSINMYIFSIISIPIIWQNPTKTKPWNTHFQFCDMSKSAGMIVSWYSGREYPCLRIASTPQQLQLLYKPRLLMLALIYSSMFIRLLPSLSLSADYTLTTWRAPVAKTSLPFHSLQCIKICFNLLGCYLSWMSDSWSLCETDHRAVVTAHRNDSGNCASWYLAKTWQDQRLIYNILYIKHKAAVGRKASSYQPDWSRISLSNRKDLVTGVAITLNLYNWCSR